MDFMYGSRRCINENLHSRERKARNLVKYILIWSVFFDFISNKVNTKTSSTALFFFFSVSRVTRANKVHPDRVVPEHQAFLAVPDSKACKEIAAPRVK